MNSESQITIGTTEIDTNTIASNLDTPWEILWGPDDQIWMTERYGKISRLNPETGEITELVTLNDVHEEAESGLLGMVLHPDFANNPYVFVVYTYLELSNIKERLVKFTYSNGKLDSPVTLLEGVVGANRHDGSRLIIDDNEKLFMTTGEAATITYSQDLTSLNGKVLRMNLDGSVPLDNPFQGSYIWTWGHRNAQGLVISPKGIMYSSEHGPANDDELNIIEKGRNYGWYKVQGFCDDGSETQFCADSNVVEPIAAWTPTLAVAGTDYYNNNAIPEWKNSLLVTSLKAGKVVALKLHEDGRSVVQEEVFFENWWGRLRDICISPDGRIFIAVSNRDGRGTVHPGDDRIIEIVSLNVVEYCTVERQASICQGETYNFYGLEVSFPGIYVDTLSDGTGCDTIVSLSLDVAEGYSKEEEIQICEGDSILLNDNYIFQPGVYVDTFTAMNGCDSIITLRVNVNELYFKEDEKRICRGDSIFLYEKYISEEGVYVDTIRAMHGCDSIASTQIRFYDPESIGVRDSVLAAVNDSITLTASEGFASYKWNEGITSQNNYYTFSASELGVGTFPYTIEVEVGQGCILTDTVILIITAVTVENRSSDIEFSVYPNPVTSDELHVDYSISTEAALIMYNQVGIEVVRKILSPHKRHTIVTLPAVSGFYYLTIHNKDGAGYRKVLNL